MTNCSYSNMNTPYTYIHCFTQTALWGSPLVPTQCPFKQTWQFVHAPANQLT